MAAAKQCPLIAAMVGTGDDHSLLNLRTASKNLTGKREKPPIHWIEDN